jgi:hypothetical protein
MGDNFYNLVKRLLIIGLILWVLYSGGKSVAIIFTEDDAENSAAIRNKTGWINIWLAVSLVILTAYGILCQSTYSFLFAKCLIVDFLTCIVLCIFHPLLKGVFLFFKELIKAKTEQPIKPADIPVRTDPKAKEEIGAHEDLIFKDREARQFEVEEYDRIRNDPAKRRAWMLNRYEAYKQTRVKNQ